MSLALAEAVRLFVAEPGASPTWLEIEDFTGHTFNHTAGEITRTRVFGNPDPHIRLGDSESSYEASGLLNTGAAGGQNLLRDHSPVGANAGEPLLFRAIYGTGFGQEQECRVTDYGGNMTADGPYIEVSFSFEGDGPVSDDVALPT